MVRVKKAQARRSHLEIKGADTDDYGALARQGGGLLRVPGGITGYDGAITRERLRYLAKLCGKGGFVVSLRTGNRVTKGYAVAVNPAVRELPIRGFVKWQKILAFVMENKDLLSDPRAVLSARRDHKQGVTYLNVCAVADTRAVAERVAAVNEARDFVDMRNGRVCRVPESGKAADVLVQEVPAGNPRMRAWDPDMGDVLRAREAARLRDIARWKRARVAAAV